MPDETLRKAVALAIESILRGSTNPCEALRHAKAEMGMMLVQISDDPEHLALLKLILDEIEARIRSC